MKQIKLFLLIAVLIFVSTATFAISSDEYSIKAAFLVKFFDFITWSEGLELKDGGTITIVGDDPFGKTLDAYALKLSEQRKIEMEVVRSEQVHILENVQIVFSSENNSDKILTLLETLDNKNVVFVGEGEKFAKLGGTIAFIVKNNKVRFVINLKSAKRAGIKISSKLLRLAKVIR